MRSLRLGGLVLAVAALGCGDDDATQVIVQIYAAPDIEPDVERLRIQVEGRSVDEEFLDPPLYADDQTIRMPASGFPLQHVLAPLNDDATRSYRVTVTAIAEGNVPISEVREQSGFVAGQTRVLRVYLPGGPCRGVVCDSERSCRNGGCVSVQPIDPSELEPETVLDEPFDARVPDLDAGSDGGPTCNDGAACEIDGEACEVGQIDCSSGEPVCTAVPAPSGTVCRAAAAECDLEEQCDGEARVCPADELMPLGTVCGDGLFCSAGECKPCTASEACDTGHACERGHIECDTGAPVCIVDGPADPGTECRAAAGLCDAAERCDGESIDCPADAVLPAGELCRAPEPDQLCDEPDLCDGVSPICTQSYRPEGSVCRDAAGPCDAAETCSGSGPACPDDARAMAGMVCRSATQPDCDLAETCNGLDVSCPDDRFASAGTECGPELVCDGDGGCFEAVCGEACSTGNPCERGRWDCQSGTAVCVNDGFLDASTVCRAAAGPCDEAETCTGRDAACPDDRFGSGAVCRPSAGDCDVDDVCDGTGPGCPNDARRDNTFVCRPAETGSCDVPEMCIGDVRCPDDQYRVAGEVCRVATGGCDLPDVCSGTGPTCPADAVQPSTFECRAAGGGCGIAEMCDGMGKTCPADLHAAANTRCRSATGVCDVDDFCTGMSATCTNGFASTSTVCRAAVDLCDAPESCTGTSAMCPNDVLQPTSYVCRPPAGPCDAQEMCDSGTTTCPADRLLGQGSTCNDPSGAAGLCDGMSVQCQSGGTDCPAFTECAGGLCGTDGSCQHFLISEVRPKNTTNPGFVELYNPYPFVVRAACSFEYHAGWAVAYDNTIDIPAYGFTLVSLDPNNPISTRGPVNDTPSGTRQVLIRCANPQGIYEPVDAFAWDNFAGAVEGPSFGTLAGSASAERKASATSTPQSMGGGERCAGNAYDTNQNNANFVLQLIGGPQETPPAEEEAPGLACGAPLPG